MNMCTAKMSYLDNGHSNPGGGPATPRPSNSASAFAPPPPSLASVLTGQDAQAFPEKPFASDNGDFVPRKRPRAVFRAKRLRSAFGVPNLTDTVEFRTGVSNVHGGRALRKLARKIKLFAIKFAQEINGRSFDVFDERLLTDQHIEAFIQACEDESSQVEQFEALMPVFKEKAFAAIHTCLGFLGAKEYRVPQNRKLRTMTFRSWLNNPEIINRVAKLAAFYVIQPKYMSTSKWPRKEILAQWANSNREAMDFFLNFDDYSQ